MQLFGEQKGYSKDNLPIMGSGPDVCGVFSDRINKNTEKDSNNVIPRESFSPEAAGTQNIHEDKIVNTMVGTMIFNT